MPHECFGIITRNSANRTFCATEFHRPISRQSIRPFVGRGQQLPRPSSNSDYSKHQASISLASETGNSLTGSVSGECSQHSNSNTATTTTTTTATATHRERRMSPGVVMLGGDYQDSTPPPPPHTNTTMEETADDDDSSTGGGVAASKLKFKRRMLNIAADKAGGVVRRYHQKRLGVAGCARVSCLFTFVLNRSSVHEELEYCRLSLLKWHAGLKKI